MNTFSNKKVILIKLGGSVITDKNKPKTANLDKIRQLAQELALASKKTATRIILGHGGGSFPHPPAHKYQTHLGFINKDSAYGLAEVRQACLELNLIIISALVKVGLPAASLAPFNFLTAKNKKVDKIFLPPLLNMLKFNVLPVIYGDVVSDSSIGSTIYSTETILNLLATKLPKFSYQPQLIIEIGKTEGVIDRNGQTIPEINSNNFKAVKSQLTGSESTDVTGGMLHKVQEAYTLAKKGVPTLIISSKEGNLKKAILDQRVSGTWIMAKYVFKPYDPIFPSLFEKEKRRLISFIGPNLVIEHVGSTAIPGLGGKNIIDICLAVEKKRMQEVSQKAREAGYQFIPHASFKDRLFHQIDLLDKKGGKRRYHLHVLNISSHDYKNLIIFRDYLRTHPQDLKKYAQIKKTAAQKAQENKDIYMTMKEPEIRRILAKAK